MWIMHICVVLCVLIIVLHFGSTKIAFANLTYLNLFTLSDLFAKKNITLTSFFQINK